MITGIHHHSVNVSDMDRSLAFYRDLLGLKHIVTIESGGEEISRAEDSKRVKIKMALLHAGENIVELIQYIHPKGKPYNMSECDTGNMHIAFHVTDIYEFYKNLKQKGVKFKTSPNEVVKGPTKGWIWTYFYDPDGAQLELVEQR